MDQDLEKKRANIRLALLLAAVALGGPHGRTVLTAGGPWDPGPKTWDLHSGRLSGRMVGVGSAQVAVAARPLSCWIQ